MNLKRLSYKHKNNKFGYYFINYLRQIVPSFFFKNGLKRKLKYLNQQDLEKVITRVNYYNKLEKSISLTNPTQLKDINLKNTRKTYFFDLFEYGRYFNNRLKANFLFGDIVHIPEEPSLLKSRPILENNTNSVLLKWNKIRHYLFIKNDKGFLEKKNSLVWRGSVHPRHPHRIKFLEMYNNHPMCNIGRVNKSKVFGKKEWLKERITINKQLDYKFILSIEGNDVATNLKWIMSSNSIAVMPKPKYETWFMEGTLVPNYHYILINDNYSNLEEQLKYYINNPLKALEIISNANAYVEKFKDKKTEDLISLLVLKKYFEKTNQL